MFQSVSVCHVLSGSVQWGLIQSPKLFAVCTEMTNLRGELNQGEVTLPTKAISPSETHYERARTHALESGIYLKWF